MRRQNSPVVWQISVRTTPEAEEAVAEILGSRFGVQASSYTSLEQPGTIVSIFLSRKPPGFAARRKALASQFRRLKNLSLQPGPCTISLSRVTAWAQSWKRHFKPIVAGRVLVKPGWSRRRPRRGQVQVVLDPGLAFGTGQHPTTSFCLEQVALLRREGQNQSFLDLGTGSGILAITAARLGYRPVLAVDFDPAAVRVAKANAQRNGVAGQLRIEKGEVRRLSRAPQERFDLICANLLADVLTKESRRIVAQLEPGGMLVVAGILKNESDRIREVYCAAGLRLKKQRKEREWWSARFESKRSQ